MVETETGRQMVAIPERKDRFSNKDKNDALFLNWCHHNGQYSEITDKNGSLKKVRPLPTYIPAKVGMYVTFSVIGAQKYKKDKGVNKPIIGTISGVYGDPRLKGKEKGGLLINHEAISCLWNTTTLSRRHVAFSSKHIPLYRNEV